MRNATDLLNGVGKNMINDSTKLQTFSSIF